MKIVELEQGSIEWLSWRREGIGGSDAPAVEGISPYRTLRELYFDKIGAPIVDDSKNDFIFAKGHKVEAMIRSEFSKLVKAEIHPACMIHDEFEHVRASLDGYHPSLGVLEAKLVGQDVIKKADTEQEIPAHHYSQMQHQFAVSGAEVGQWFGHDGKKTGILLEVRADKEYIKRLLDKEHEFWERVKHRNPPPLSDSDYLIPDELTILEALREAKVHAENAKVAFELLKERVVNEYRHPKIAGAGLKIFQTVRQGRLDLLKIPEVLKAAEDKLSTLDTKYVESFRTIPTESWTVKIEG